MTVKLVPKPYGEQGWKRIIVKPFSKTSSLLPNKPWPLLEMKYEGGKTKETSIVAIWNFEIIVQLLHGVLVIFFFFLFVWLLNYYRTLEWWDAVLQKQLSGLCFVCFVVINPCVFSAICFIYFPIFPSPPPPGCCSSSWYHRTTTFQENPSWLETCPIQGGWATSDWLRQMIGWINNTVIQYHLQSWWCGRFRPNTTLFLFISYCYIYI